MWSSPFGLGLSSVRLGTLMCWWWMRLRRYSLLSKVLQFCRAVLFKILYLNISVWTRSVNHSLTHAFRYRGKHSNKGNGEGSLYFVSPSPSSHRNGQVQSMASTRRLQCNEECHFFRSPFVVFHDNANNSTYTMSQRNSFHVFPSSSFLLIFRILQSNIITNEELVDGPLQCILL